MNNWENNRNRNSYRNKNTLNDQAKSDKAVLEKKDSDNVLILDKIGYVTQAEKVIQEMNKNKNKIKSYDIDKCKFSAKIVTTNGDSECVLNITDENGNIDYIDCELIGFSQFNNLLNDLKIIGDEANPIKIKTITKGVER